MDLINYIETKIPVSEEVKEAINAESTILTVKKGQVLINPEVKSDKMSTSILFLEQGLIRVFSIKKEKQLTMRFLTENCFSFSIERNLNKEVSKFSWEVLETSKIRVFDFIKFEAVLDKYPALEKFTRQELMLTLLECQELAYSSRTLSAEERFQELMKKNPSLFLRAPQGHIASYLGITPPVLSLLRSKSRR